MPTHKQRIQETLYKSSLFAELTEAELDKLAEQYHLNFPDRGTRIVQQDEKADRFYLIHRGNVEMLWNDGREEISMAFLEPGDYFGEEGLLGKKIYQLSAEAGPATALIEITQDQFKRLVKDHPDVKQALQMVANTQELAQKMKFEWLGEDENVYMIARRHWFILFRRMFGPLLLWAVALLLAFWGWISVLSLPWVIAGILFVTAILWSIWIVLDWRNDYYIVTNDRIVWLEKVIGLYENRQEAPLYTILSTDVQTSAIGNVLGYGDARVKTFTGMIFINGVSTPQQIVDMIQELRQRAAIRQEIESHEAVRQTVRESIGLEPRQKQGLPARRWRKRSQPSYKMPPIWRDFVHMRLEQGDTITYRKHWLLLIRHTWLPALLLIFMIWLATLQILNGFVMAVLLLIPVAWWFYRYVDWRNDIFQVTSDKIYDIDRKPLGSEQRKEAPLGNILSLEVERLGFFRIIMNYGNVNIDVSGSRFVFENIFDPARAQQDIFRRIDALKQHQRDAEDQKERDRLAEWFGVYDDEAKNPYNWNDIEY